MTDDKKVVTTEGRKGFFKTMRERSAARRAKAFRVLTPGEATAAMLSVKRSLFWTRIGLAVTLAGGGLFYLSSKANDDALTKQNVSICEGQKTNRDVLTRLIEKSFSQNTGDFDLTQIPGFENIGDAGTKQWIESFSALIAAGGTSSGVDKNKNNVPDDIDKILAEPVC